MKAILKYTTSLGLVLILLISTLQMSIYRMDCLMSGKTKISLSEFDDCNQNNPKKDCSIAQQCCCFHQMDLNFEFDSDLSKDAPTLISAGLTKTLNAEIHSVETPKVLSFYYTDLPPPGGMNLLKEIQIYRL